MAARFPESRDEGRRPRRCPPSGGDLRLAARAGAAETSALSVSCRLAALARPGVFLMGVQIWLPSWTPHHKPGLGPSDKNKAADAREKAPGETADKIHTKKSARRSSPRRLSAFKTNYSALIAPVGQAPSQAPQSMQLPASTTALSAMLIAPTGQVSTQAPQATHSSETI